MHSRSSQDPVREAIELGVARVRAAVEEVSASNAVVVIDGRSGAGKTTIARLLSESWPLLAPAQTIALDSIYPGWDGLDEGSERARELILLPHGRGLHSTWQRFDWVAGEYAESHAVDPNRGLIVEGSGILTPRSARLADVRVWVESPDAVRRTRALTRDGDTYRPHWERWARQEERHIRRDDPRSLATIVIDVP
ncbi:hypothetical protein ACFU0W_02560 [Microbacterium keratanolyticum]|uniref:hypothetical protein n=1 Tax=Microbacterium keratanolyticum TaxID=67574 RepID=UPI0036315569